MRLLIDTHCWVWFLLAPERLNARARAILAAPEHEAFFSTASAWEILIKQNLGKLELPAIASEYIPSRLEALGHRVLPVLLSHVLRLETLSPHHKDPFDRMLVSQALEEDLQLLTADRIFFDYGAAVIWAGTGRP